MFRAHLSRSTALLAALLLPLLAAAQGAPAVVGGKRWAIVIGAGGYEHFSPLKYTPRDAKRFSEKLIEKFGFESETVKLLTDDAGPKMTPTAGHILGELAVLLKDKRLDRSDLFVFYFSGHGVGLPSGDYLMPLDGRPETAEQLGVPVKKVIEQFTNAGLRNVLVISDACRSGEKNPFGQELQRLADKANIAVMLGCEPGQISRESPSLRASVFTHFLLEAMEDASLRDSASGALWSRKIAEKVAASAYEFSERDYGKYAQRPAAWTDPTRDVLLGVFPPADSSDASMKAFLAQAKELNKSSYASALTSYAERVFESNLLKESIEVFKVLDQIGELSPAGRYLYSVALTATDRLLEASRIIQSFPTDEWGSFYRDLALASTTSQAVPIEERTAAAMRVWKIEPGFEVGTIVWNLLKYNGRQDEKESFLKEFAATLEGKGRRHYVIQGELLMVQGKYREAAKMFQTALQHPDDFLTDYIVDLYWHEAILRHATDDEIIAWLKKHAEKGDKAGYWGVLLAIRYSVTNRTDEAIASLKDALGKGVDAAYLWTAVKTAGLRAAELADRVAVLAKEHPYSWKAHLADAMASGLKAEGVRGAFYAYEKAKKLVDEPAMYAFEGIAFLKTCSESAFNEGKVDRDFKIRFYQAACGELTPFADRLGVDEEFWLLFVQLMVNGERNALLAEIVNRQFDPVGKPGAIPPSLAVTLWMAYANSGDLARSEALLKSAKVFESEKPSLLMMLASQQACAGKFAEARANLPKRADAPGLEELYDAVHAWLLAKEGKKDEARTIAKRYEETLLPYVQAVVGLVFAELGDWEAADPFLHTSRFQRSPGFFYLHAKAVNVLYDRARSQKNQALVDTLVYEASISQPGNPVFQHLFYGSDDSVKAFAGTMEFTVAGNSDWSDPLEGKLTLTVLPSGKVTGVVERASGAVHTISGTIDKLGNASGKVKIGNEELTFLAKLPPVALYETLETFAKQGLLFQSQRPNGTRYVWFCKPIAASRRA